MSQPLLQERFGIRLYKEYFNFAAAHFLIFPDGSREELHGHNYRATLELDGPLGPGGLVADFLQVKPVFRALCDGLDHRVLLPGQNRFLDVEEDEREVTAKLAEDRWIFPRRDVRVLPIENTASELLARHLCMEFMDALARHLPFVAVQRVLVSVQESRGQSAVYERTAE